MKNNLIKILSITLIFLFNSNLFADELDIKANQVKFNKDSDSLTALSASEIQIDFLFLNAFYFSFPTEALLAILSYM